MSFVERSEHVPVDVARDARSLERVIHGGGGSQTGDTECPEDGDHHDAADAD